VTVLLPSWTAKPRPFTVLQGPESGGGAETVNFDGPGPESGSLSSKHTNNQVFIPMLRRRMCAGAIWLFHCDDAPGEVFLDLAAG
jgi:hypothetical protein